MAVSYDNLKRQYFTAKRALENAQGDGIEQIQKCYDEAKRQFEAHPQHPDNKVKKPREKRF